MILLIPNGMTAKMTTNMPAKSRTDHQSCMVYLRAWFRYHHSNIQIDNRMEEALPPEHVFSLKPLDAGLSARRKSLHKSHISAQDIDNRYSPDLPAEPTPSGLHNENTPCASLLGMMVDSIEMKRVKQLDGSRSAS